jgi:hypothetical protein
MNGAQDYVSQRKREAVKTTLLALTLNEIDGV